MKGLLSSFVSLIKLNFDIMTQLFGLLHATLATQTVVTSVILLFKRSMNIRKMEYRIFSIKRPRRLFQTWLGGPGVCLNQQFIWARHFFFKKGLFVFLGSRVSCP